MRTTLQWDPVYFLCCCYRQLLDPHPHSPSLHVQHLFVQNFSLSRTLHILEDPKKCNEYVDIDIQVSVDDPILNYISCIDVRMFLCCLISLPLGAAMIGVGSTALASCEGFLNQTQSPNLTSSCINDTSKEADTDWSLEMIHIPLWLVVMGVMLLILPVVYILYDTFCKPENLNPGKPGSWQKIMINLLIHF